MLSSVLAGSILLTGTFCFSAFHSWPFGIPLFDIVWKKAYGIERFWPERIEEPQNHALPSRGSKLMRIARLSLAAVARWLLPGSLGLAGILSVDQVFYPPLLSFRTPYQYIQIFGAFVLLASLLLLTWAGSFVVRYVYGKPPNQRHLLKAGPYKYVRHPIYLSFVLFGIGTVLVSLNLLMLITLAYLALMAHVYQSEEDKELAEAYGKEYKEYKRSTGGFFPKILGKS